ncbi:hypothetical protein ERICIV_00621 [Paenibacillus larvae subsp. larvae]|uniref:Uncharacterized protein n=2 Tax=Paenibacillus larvae TaxID=1464 RepID=A0A2L1TVZ2_9BACL|nr:hypothetical protein ERICIII_00622 [Paenibacillus larvae subsp. larvae]AVF29602.1 hypothetical protein ERICIV_00621 [Paenibacillus larvae subsp. larvae]
MNREIEFSYKGELFALVYHKEGWCLVNRKENLSKYYKTNRELINEIRIDGYSFEELLQNENMRIEHIFYDYVRYSSITQLIPSGNFQ